MVEYPHEILSFVLLPILKLRLYFLYIFVGVEGLSKDGLHRWMILHPSRIAQQRGATARLAVAMANQRSSAVHGHGHIILSRVF